jgi:hypothetical protein
LVGHRKSAAIALLGPQLIVYHAQKVASQPMDLGLVVTFVGCLY